MGIESAYTKSRGRLTKPRLARVRAGARRTDAADGLRDGEAVISLDLNSKLMVNLSRHAFKIIIPKREPEKRGRDSREAAGEQVTHSHHRETKPSFGSLLLTADETQSRSIKKRPELINRKGVVIHHDNTRPHKFLATQQILREFGGDLATNFKAIKFRWYVTSALVLLAATDVSTSRPRRRTQHARWRQRFVLRLKRPPRGAARRPRAAVRKCGRLKYEM
ncbi:hypothetical protein EVAR_60827_1 [Eumeta japonica]|uniref:Histone-lysine N-methyltransferase SETMAR n=1 Tax=Eumeta variegata TaxID=151549 RepID=A0A4C1ZZA7_EUMVA|nr:hypothetical protein EVAR_60827_1 [Eumeta japonica]